MHPAAPIRHGRALTCASTPALGSASRRGMSKGQMCLPAVCVCVGFIVHSVQPPLWSAETAPGRNLAGHNGLAALAHMDVLNGHDLTPPRAHPLKGEDALLVA